MRKHKLYLALALAAALTFAGCSGKTDADSTQTDAGSENAGGDVTDATGQETDEETTTGSDSDAEAGDGDNSGDQAADWNLTPVEAPSTDSPLTGVDGWDVVDAMGIGYNIGNSFDATGNSDATAHETAWGNPVISQDFVDAIADAGFQTVRIPVTWGDFVDAENGYKIDEDYLARVKEVVDYCYQDDLYVILNVHHDSWIENENLVTDQEEVAAEQEAIWTQLAIYFADYDMHLIFESMNEPRLSGTDIEWTGNAEAYETVNYLNLVFANAVRSVDQGYNEERCLAIPQYAASNSTSVLGYMTIPVVDGEACNNVIISVHSYAPYNFCLNTQATFDPESSADTSDMDQMFATLKEEFLDQNIPVYIGETGATGKTDVNERVEWAEYMSTEAAEYGIPIVIWDNGCTGVGNECHSYIDRSTCEELEPEIIEALMNGRTDTEWRSALTEEEEEESLIDGTVLASFPEGVTNTGTWDYTFVAFGSKPSYYIDGASIALVYTGEGSVKMVVDSESNSQWWIPVDPSKVEDVGDYHVAYFDAADILKEAAGFDVASASELSNVHFLVSDKTVTAYEACLVSDAASAVYYVEGGVYYMGSDLPDDPEVAGMEFLGWYTTKTYDAGTEYDPATAEGSVNVYAKMGLAE